MEVHFSIDDVLNTLRWCAFNRPKSIFEMNFFGDLKRWHEIYGLKVSLYCFYGNGNDFCVEDLPDRYWEELKNQCSWLRMAYHGSMDEKAEKEIFLKEQKRFREVIGGELSTSIVRLHCWKAWAGVLEEGGVFLCPYYDRLPYDLEPAEWEKLKTVGTITKIKREYWMTDICYDYLQSLDTIDGYMGEKRLVIFGHEWMFKEKRNLIAGMLKKFGNVDYLY